MDLFVRILVQEKSITNPPSSEEIMTEMCSVAYCGIELASLFAVVAAVVIAALWFAETISDRQCEKHKHPITELTLHSWGYERHCRCGKNRRTIVYEE